MPKYPSDEDCDQEMPLEVSDACIEKTRILTQPDGESCPAAGLNAYIRLDMILSRVIQYIYPVKSVIRGSGQGSLSCKVSFAKVEELERELQHWKEGLPTGYRMGSDETLGSGLRYDFPNCL
jgi:hypothetical protein